MISSHDLATFNQTSPCYPIWDGSCFRCSAVPIYSNRLAFNSISMMPLYFLEHNTTEWRLNFITHSDSCHSLHATKSNDFDAHCIRHVGTALCETFVYSFLGISECMLLLLCYVMIFVSRRCFTSSQTQNLQLMHTLAVVIIWYWFVSSVLHTHLSSLPSEWTLNGQMMFIPNSIRLFVLCTFIHVWLQSEWSAAASAPTESECPFSIHSIIDHTAHKVHRIILSIHCRLSINLKKNGHFGEFLFHSNFPFNNNKKWVLILPAIRQKRKEYT